MLSSLLGTVCPPALVLDSFPPRPCSTDLPAGADPLCAWLSSRVLESCGPRLCTPGPWEGCSGGGAFQGRG